MLCGWARRQMVCADALSDEERWALEEHVRQCPECARHWQQWERLRELLAHLPSVAPPPDAKQKLLATLHRLPSTPLQDWDCATARRHLWRWLDGDLNPSEQISLLAHLAECDACQSELWVSERLLTLLRTFPRVPAPSEGKEAIKKRLAFQRRRPMVFWRIAVPLAAAAALIVALIGYGRRNFPQGGEPLTVTRRPTPTPTPSAPGISALTSPSPKTVKAVPRMPKVVAKQKQPRKAAKSAQPSQPLRSPRRLAQQPASSLPVSFTLRPSPRKTDKRTRLLSSQSSLVLQPSSPAPLTSEERPSLADAERLAPEPKIASVPLMPEPKPTPPPERVRPAEPPLAQPTETPIPPTPTLAPPASSEGKWVALPPITIEEEKPFVRPTLRLSTVPPSQRLYQRAGVAFLRVEPEKRPLLPPEPMPSSEPSIPMAAERFRSRTAVIPLTRFGISW